MDTIDDSIFYKRKSYYRWLNKKTKIKKRLTGEETGQFFKGRE